MIIFKFNWFRKENHFKKNSPEWYGIYECSQKSCPNRRIQAIFKEINTERDNFMIIELEDKSEHEDFINFNKKTRICGEERVAISTNLLAYGSSNTKYEHILDYKNGKVHNKNLFNDVVLKKIKFEATHKLRYSNKIMDDIEATKIMADDLCGDLGYIQNINFNPFGFLLISRIQVKFIYINYKM